MIVVRNVFRLQFGKSREAVALFKEGLALAKKSGVTAPGARILTDVVGPFYTLVLELEFASVSEWESHSKALMSNPTWTEWYPKAAALSRDGYREILNIVE